MNKWFYALGVLASWAICLPLQYRGLRRENRLMAQFFKALPVFLLGVLVLVLHFAKTPGEMYGLWVGIGLLLGSLGDAILNISMMTGGVFFFLGHVCDCVGYTILSPVRWWTILLAMGIYAVMMLLTFRKLRVLGQKPPVVFCLSGYALMLAFMLSVTIPLSLRINTYQAFLAGLGGICFVSADGWLLANTLKKRVGKHRFYALLLYYTAQALIALSAVWNAL